MQHLYTSGDWRVKEGSEEQFVAAWRELAEWSMREVPGARWARLLRDRDHPRYFVSFGPWESLEAIESWRTMSGFQERVTKLRDLLEAFEPRTFDLAAEVG